MRVVNHLEYSMVALVQMSLMEVLFTLGRTNKVLFLVKGCFY